MVKSYLKSHFKKMNVAQVIQNLDSTFQWICCAAILSLDGLKFVCFFCFKLIIILTIP